MPWLTDCFYGAMLETRNDARPEGCQKLRLAGLLLVAVFSMSSCVPVAIGAAGLAVGYIARDEGFGQAPPLEGGSSGGGGAYDAPAVYDSPAAYEDTPSDYDLPVY